MKNQKILTVGLVVGVAAVSVILGAGVSLSQCVPIAESNFGPGATTLNFEVDGNGSPLVIGAPLQTAYASVGALFDSTDQVGGPSGLHSPPNIAIGSITDFSPINVTFTLPAQQVGAWGFDFEMEGFDANGASLGVVVYSGDGIPGLFGPDEFAFIGLSCATNIARVVFRHHFPFQAVYGFNIDDVRFGTHCGDGVIDDGEQCDDGNVEVGDGCDAACQTEPCFACNENLAQCIGDLSQSSTDLGQCQTDLAVCLSNGVVPDNDGDAEQDLTDACPDTLTNQPVDDAGCSQPEFCAKVDVTVRENRRLCRKSDWMNDEPTTGSPRDCEIDKGGVAGSSDDTCVPYVE